MSGVLAFAWFFATFTVCTAWVTHFAHIAGRASVGAMALTAGIWLLSGVAFAIAAVFEAAR